MRLLGLPDALRTFGLEPVVVAGWENRGNDLYRVGGSIDHHTAGARTGYLPSLNTLVYGRADLPGPLCNVAAPRSEPGDWRVWVIAAGKANHAGAGFLDADPTVDSNYELAGLERELVGDGSDLTPHRHEVACRVHAAFLTLGGWRDAARLQRHATYATPDGRKIDTRGVTDAELRARTAMLISAGGAGGTPQEAEAMEAEFVYMLERVYHDAPADIAAWDVDRRTGFDWNLWRLTSGQVSREALRSAYASDARSAGLIR